MLGKHREPVLVCILEEFYDNGRKHLFFAETMEAHLQGTANRSFVLFKNGN